MFFGQNRELNFFDMYRVFYLFYLFLVNQIYYSCNYQIELGVSKLRICREVVIFGIFQEFSFYG